MNGKKAKALRNAVGFDSRAPREYLLAFGVKKFSMRPGSKLTRPGDTGTFVSTGPRRQYQAAKRLVRHLL